MIKTVIILLLFFSFHCKKANVNQENISEAKAISIFKYGEIKKAENEFKINDFLKYGEEITLSKNSICDLQIEKESWMFRVKGPSNFKYNKSKSETSEENWELIVKEGRVLGNIDRKLKPKESFNIITPTAVLGVRGTKFLLEISENGDTKILVIDGSMSYSFTEANNLTSKPEINKFLTKKEIIIDKGKSFEVNKKLIQKLESIPNLEEANLTKVFSEMQEKDVVSLPDAKLKLLESEVNGIKLLSIDSFQSKELLEKSIEKRVKENSKELIQIMKNLSGKPKTTLVLTNGEEVEGILIQHDSISKKFVIETPLGIKEYNESQVLEEL